MKIEAEHRIVGVDNLEAILEEWRPHSWDVGPSLLELMTEGGGILIGMDRLLLRLRQGLSHCLLQWKVNTWALRLPCFISRIKGEDDGDGCFCFGEDTFLPS